MPAGKVIVVFAAVESAITGLLSSPLIEETVQGDCRGADGTNGTCQGEGEVDNDREIACDTRRGDIWLLTVPCTPLSTTVVESEVFAPPLSDAVGSVNVAVTVTVPPTVAAWLKMDDMIMVLVSASLLTRTFEASKAELLQSW